MGLLLTLHAVDPRLQSLRQFLIRHNSAAMGETDEDRVNQNQAVQVMITRGAHPNHATRPREEGSKAPQYIYTIAATMSAFCAGMALAWTGPALAMIEMPDNATATTTNPNAAFYITKEQGSWVGSLVTIGGLIGALPTGYIANIFGRKIVCASLSLPFLVGWIITAFASSAWHLYVARLIMGIATGASSAVAPMYVAEIAESSVRGSLGSFFQLLLTVGILYTYTVGAFVSYTYLAAACAVMPVVFLVMFFNAPETPTYLLSKGRRSEAQASLRRLRGRYYDVNYELNELQRELDRSADNEASFSEIFTRKAARSALIICLGLMIFQQLSGVNAVIFYANNIFKDAGSTLSPSISAIIIGVIQVVCTYASTLLVDKAGRKILLLISAAVMAVCQGLLAFYFYKKDHHEDVSGLSMMPLASVGLFIVIFSIGFGPIPWMMTGELFAPDVKGPATGMAVGLNWLMAFVVTKTFDPLKTALGSGVMFGIFGIICAIGVAFVALLVIETKGKSLDQIQNILSGEKGRKKNQVT